GRRRQPCRACPPTRIGASSPRGCAPSARCAASRCTTASRRRSRGLRGGGSEGRRRRFRYGSSAAPHVSAIRQRPHHRAALLVEQLVGSGDHYSTTVPAAQLLEIRGALDALASLLGHADPTNIEDIKDVSGHRCCLSFQPAPFVGGPL